MVVDGRVALGLSLGWVVVGVVGVVGCVVVYRAVPEVDAVDEFVEGVVVGGEVGTEVVQVY